MGDENNPWRWKISVKPSEVVPPTRQSVQVSVRKGSWNHTQC